MRRAAVGLYGPAAGAGIAGLGAVHLGERFPRGRALRRALQLVPVPGKLLRPGALRMDARELEPAARRQDRVPMPPSTCSSSSRSSTTASSTSASARTATSAIRIWTVGPDRALAERLLSRQPLRVARAGRRREHAQRLLVLHARAERARALRAGNGADLGEPDQGRQRPLDHEPRHQPGHHRLGRAGRDRRPHQGEYRRQRPRHRDDPQAVSSTSSTPSRAARTPRATIRSSNVAKCVELPYFQKKESIEGITLEEFDKYPLLKVRLKGFRHCFGQPPEVRRAFEEAMGIAK